jgi:hypothetical protein
LNRLRGSSDFSVVTISQQGFLYETDARTP